MRIFIILYTFFILFTLGNATNDDVSDHDLNQLDDASQIFLNIKELISKVTGKKKPTASQSVTPTATATTTITIFTTVLSFTTTPTTITTTVVPQPRPPETRIVTITSTMATTSAVTTTATTLTTATATVTTTSTVTATVTTSVHQTNSAESTGQKPKIKVGSMLTQSVDLAKTIHKAANIIKSIVSSSASNPAQPDQSVLSQSKIQELQRLVEEMEQNSNKALKLGEFILKVAQVIKDSETTSSGNSLGGSVIIRSG